MPNDPKRTNYIKNNFSLPLEVQSRQKYFRQSNIFNEIEEAIIKIPNEVQADIDLNKIGCDYNLQRDLFNVENLKNETSPLKDILKQEEEAFNFSNLLAGENSESEISEQEFQHLLLFTKREDLYKKEFRKNINHISKKYGNYSSGIILEYDSNQGSQVLPKIAEDQAINTPIKPKRTTPKKPNPNNSNYTPSPVKSKKHEIIADKNEHKNSYTSMKDRSRLFSDITKKNIAKYQKNLINFTTHKILTSKKTIQNCLKEVKKKEIKSLKLEHDSIAAAKKLSRNVINYWREREKAEKHYRKKYERKAMEQQKRDFEFLELRRQQQKLNLLLTQTELYAHFAGNTPASNISESNIPESILNTITNENSLEKSLTLEDGVLVRPNKTEEYDSTNLTQMALTKVQQAIQKQQQNVLLFEDTSESTTRKGLEERLNVANAASDIEITVDPPLLFNGTLKQYQIKGFNWLVSLFHRGINGILADEMGLGKTIQTIAFLAYLAETKNLWGPFFIIAPATTLHNWQNELHNFLPEFRVLPYWGNSADRKVFRNFWNNKKHLIKTKEDAPFHVIITSYQLAVRDMRYFQRILWQFLVLDEAQAIKSNTSQRWKTLLSFNCRSRLLLTGTPIQNNLAELWSLLHFIMPTLFDNHEEFNEWFSKGIEGNVESKTTIDQSQLTRLHMIIKPFILRRTKNEVEHELSDKIEIRLKCRLSRQQQNLYDAIKNKLSLENLIQVSSKPQVKDSDDEFLEDFELLASPKEASSETGLMNLVMQFRKVCNHPALFERHLIHIPLFTEICPAIDPNIFLNKRFYKNLTTKDSDYNIFTCQNINSRYNSGTPNLFSFLFFHPLLNFDILYKFSNDTLIPLIFQEMYNEHKNQEFYHEYWNKNKSKPEKLRLTFSTHSSIWNPLLVFSSPIESVYGFAIERVYTLIMSKLEPFYHEQTTSECLFNEITLYERESRSNFPQSLKNLIARKVVNLKLSSQINQWSDRNDPYFPSMLQTIYTGKMGQSNFCDWHPEPLRGFEALRPDIGWSSIKYPSMKDFIKDSGKLIVLDKLLFCLKASKHRVLLYSQMTRMMDLLEEFLNYRQYKFIRLDGSSRIEERKEMVDAFQKNANIFVFILSTRAGGIGINLTAADTVIFYDSDWNPTVDQQAMDRAHRLGQTRQVTVYRLISSGTVEERILERATHKSVVQQMVISGNAVSFKAREFMSLILNDETLESQFKQKKADNLKRKRTRKLSDQISKVKKIPDKDEISPVVEPVQSSQAASLDQSISQIPVNSSEALPPSIDVTSTPIKADSSTLISPHKNKSRNSKMKSLNKNILKKVKQSASVSAYASYGYVFKPN